MAEAQSRMMTVSQAAAQLGISQDTLRRLADSGRIRAMTLPSGHRRFEVEEIERAKRDLLGVGPDDGVEGYSGFILKWHGALTRDGRLGEAWMNVYQRPEDAEDNRSRTFAVALVIHRDVGGRGRTDQEAVALAVDQARRRVRDRIDLGNFAPNTLYRVNIGRDGNVTERLNDLDDSVYE
jgi:excisionase family DNA binding protein